jgi:hypothetical protein
MTATQSRATALKTLALMAGLGALFMPGPAAQAQEATAEAFAKGGTFCFDIGSDGDHQRFKLVTKPASGPGPFNVIEVHGIEKGQWEKNLYLNGLAGSATIDPSSVPGSTDTALHISLMGNGNGFTKEGAPELWTLQYSFELSPATLTGKLYGYADESGPIAEGVAYAAKSSFAILRDVKTMSCDTF